MYKMYNINFKTLIITGKDLKKALKVADLTQQEAANRLDIARQTLRNWFESVELSPEIVQKVHTGLDIKLTGKSGKSLSEPDTEYNASEIKDVRVPIYNIEFSPGVMGKLIENRDSNFQVGYLSIPEVSGCDAVIRAKGQSMAPRINDGDWLGVKRVDDWQDWLQLGYMYMIETTNLQIIKYLKKGSKPDTFTIASHNTEFEEDEIPKKVIKDIWAVRTILPFSRIETII